jgi:hypothetical protein
VIVAGAKGAGKLKVGIIISQMILGHGLQQNKKFST